MQNTSSSFEAGNNVQMFAPELRSKSVELFTLILSVLTIAVGTVGNVLLSFTIANSASLRTPMNTFVLSIGLVDLLTSVLLLPLRVVVERKLLYKEEIEPKLYQVELFIRTFTDTTRLLLMMSLSVERYQSIAKPLMVSKDQAKRRALVMSGVTWTVSILLSVLSIQYFCDTVLHDPCVDITNNSMSNWGDLEIFVEMPLSLLSVTTIAVSYGLIVLILRQQRTKMSGHTKPKVNQVAPASGEKRPESSVNNLTKVTMVDVSDNGKGGSLVQAGNDVNQGDSINNRFKNKVKVLFKVSGGSKQDVTKTFTSSDRVGDLHNVSGDFKQDASKTLAPSDKVGDFLKVDSAPKRNILTGTTSSSDKVGDFHKVDSASKRNTLAGTTSSSDKVNKFLDPVDTVIQPVSTNGTSSDKVRTVLQAGNDVAQEVPTDTAPSQMTTNPHEETQEIPTDITASSNVTEIDETTKKVHTDLTISNTMKNTPTAKYNAVLQDSVTAITCDTCSRCGDKFAFDEGLNNIIKENSNTDTSADNSFNERVQAQTKGENTLQAKTDIAMDVNNSVDQNSIYNMISCVNQQHMSSLQITNKDTTETRNTVVEMTETTIKGNNSTTTPSGRHISHSVELTMENTHNSSGLMNSDRQPQPLDFINVANLQPSIDGSSFPTAPVYDTPTILTDSETKVVYQCADFFQNRVGDITQNVVLQQDHIRACSNSDLTNENAELEKVKLFNPSLSKISSLSSKIPKSRASASLHPAQNKASPFVTRSSGELPQTNDQCLETPKSTNTRLHVNESLQTNKQLPNCQFPGIQNSSVPLVDLKAAISLHENFLPAGVFSVENKKVSDNDENESIQSHNYTKPLFSSSDDSNFTSSNQILDSVQKKFTDIKTTSLDREIHRPSAECDLVHAHQDVQRICDNCASSLSSSCYQYPDPAILSHPHPTEQPSLNKENFGTFPDQRETSHLSTKEENSDVATGVTKNMDTLVSNKKISLSGSYDLPTSQASTTVTSDQLTANKSTIVTSDKVLIYESSNVANDKQTVNESNFVTSDKLTANESAVVTRDKLTANESTVVTSDKLTANESAVVTRDELTANESTVVTSDKLMTNESTVMTSDKPTTNESTVMTSDKPTANESTVMTSVKVTVDEPSQVQINNPPSSLTPNKTTAEGKHFEVVDMDGTVRMQLSNATSTKNIEGAVCLMNPKNREQGKRRVELKAALKVGLLVCCFACLWMPLPISVCIFRRTFGDSQTMKVDVIAVFSALATSTAAVDPILYGLLNRQIRSALMASVLKVKRKIKNCRK